MGSRFRGNDDSMGRHPRAGGDPSFALSCPPSRPVKRALLALAGLAAALLLVCVVRAARLTVPAVTVPPPAPFTVPPGAVERLAASVRIPTVSSAADTAPAAVARRDSAFARLHAHLAASFPRVHAALRREVLGRHALLYTWPGTDPALGPLVLMAHQDVVPVEPGTEGAWQRPPFSGAVAGGFVWGRGTLDDKHNLMAHLEAVEALLAEGARPRRTVLLAFGDDEEIGGGAGGAAAIVARLRAAGVRPWLVVDEGGAVTQGLVPGVARPVAVVGVAEKGYLTVELEARGAGGHSSAPPRHTAAGLVARAAARVEGSPMPARTDGAARLLLDHVAPAMPFAQRVVVANRWLFGPVLVRMLGATPSGDAAQRTTTAVTMLEGSPKDNVLPSRARAVVNFRLMPGDAPDAVLAHVRRAADDSAVRVRALGTPAPASPVSPDTGAAWGAVATTVRQLFPGALVAPYLVIGATDARFFAPIAPAVYRFSPVPMTPRDLERMHGTNERVAVEDYLRAVRFSAQLVRNAAM